MHYKGERSHPDFISSSLIAKTANRYGRKPVYIVLQLIDLSRQVLYLFSAATMGSALVYYAIATSALLGMFAGPVMASLLGTMMVVDTVDPAQRYVARAVVPGIS